MKTTILLFTIALALKAEDKPKPVDFQAKYTKALIDMVNAKFDDDKLESDYKKAKQASNDRQVAAGNAINQALQAKTKECEALKQQLDSKTLDDTGLMACFTPKEAK